MIGTLGPSAQTPSRPNFRVPVPDGVRAEGISSGGDSTYYLHYSIIGISLRFSGLAKKNSPTNHKL